MPAHQETRILPYSPEQMFALVADVERYPEFVPGCAGLRVRAREGQGRVEYLIADMIVAYGGLRERYTSRVCLDLRSGTVTATMVEGPFQKMETRWRFSQRPEGCEIHFFIDFAFKSRLLSSVANLAFDMMARKMTDAFVARAHTLYGAGARQTQTVAARQRS
jgi:coenzyme Q-binding protein COQ10